MGCHTPAHKVDHAKNCLLRKLFCTLNSGYNIIIFKNKNTLLFIIGNSTKNSSVLEAVLEID